MLASHTTCVIRWVGGEWSTWLGDMKLPISAWDSTHIQVSIIYMSLHVLVYEDRHSSTEQHHLCTNTCTHAYSHMWSHVAHLTISHTPHYLVLLQNRVEQFNSLKSYNIAHILLDTLITHRDSRSWQNKVWRKTRGPAKRGLLLILSNRMEHKFISQLPQHLSCKFHIPEDPPPQLGLWTHWQFIYEFPSNRFCSLPVEPP